MRRNLYLRDVSSSDFCINFFRWPMARIFRNISLEHNKFKRNLFFLNLFLTNRRFHDYLNISKWNLPLDYMTRNIVHLIKTLLGHVELGGQGP